MGSITTWIKFDLEFGKWCQKRIQTRRARRRSEEKMTLDSTSRSIRALRFESYQNTNENFSRYTRDKNAMAVIPDIFLNIPSYWTKP